MCSMHDDPSVTTAAEYRRAVRVENTDPPCIAGDHYPNDAGTACYYCGLPAEIVAPDELAAAWAIVATGGEA